MNSFSFIYHDKKHQGNFLDSDKGRGWVKAIFFEHSAILYPSAIQNKNNRKIWVQVVNTGEAVWPHELIQILGEAIEEFNNNNS